MSGKSSESPRPLETASDHRALAGVVILVIKAAVGHSNVPVFRQQLLIDPCRPFGLSVLDIVQQHWTDTQYFRLLPLAEVVLLHAKLSDRIASPIALGNRACDDSKTAAEIAVPTPVVHFMSSLPGVRGPHITAKPCAWPPQRGHFSVCSLAIVHSLIERIGCSWPVSALAEGLPGQLAHSLQRALRCRSHSLISCHDECSWTSITSPHDWHTCLVCTAANLLQQKPFSPAHPPEDWMDGGSKTGEIRPAGATVTGFQVFRRRCCGISSRRTLFGYDRCLGFRL